MAQRDGMRRLELISLHLASGAGCSVRPLLMVNHEDRAVDEWPLRATSGRSETAAWERSKVKTVLKLWSSARYRGAEGGMAEELSCLRRHRHPGNIAEVRRPRLCKGKRLNSKIISSMIESH